MKPLLTTIAALSFGCLSLSPAYAGGSSWGSVSNVPAEADNVLSTVYAEQDFTHWENGRLSFKSFLNGTASADTAGNDWNNKLTLRAGGKLAYAVGDSGMVALRFGAAYEHRFQSGDSDAAPFLSAEYWFGWGQDTPFPGSSWGVVGNISPAEKDNIHLVTHLEQGLFAQDFGSGSIVPFVEATLSRDTDKYDWNNKNQFGAGVKYRHPLGDNGTFDISLKYQHESRTRSNTSDSGLVLTAGYWVGW